MRVLIIGGTGLISHAITRRMIAQGGFDITHYNRGQRARKYDAPVRTITGDRYDYPAFAAQMRDLQDAGSGFDVVIEMIGYKPADIESLREAFAGRVGQVVFCSTVDVYSKPPARYPVPNDADQSHPADWDYAQNKAACEALLRAAHQRGDFPVTILRPAHTYDDHGALLHSFIAGTAYLDRIRRGLPIITHGDGESLWVSCHADDVATAFVNACDNDKTFGRGYALPGHEWRTWNDVHRTVAKAIVAPPPRLVHIPTDLLARLSERANVCRINFRYNNIFETAEARADLGFDPQITFAEGTKRVYDTLDAAGKIASAESDPEWDVILRLWEKHTDAMLAERKTP
ncbi:MAG: NAD-dependent epimerase/dehydratase family protein [Armatimonadetes bacterium]|nr:NAD-dependent epimerase/dehydratase family protein [Armatimonadota bacterium]